MTEKQIKHENGNYWVADEKDCYTVYKIGITHSTSDSSYTHNTDGLSIAIARCNYLAKNASLPCSQCGIDFKPYWLKDGVCNGCRNPHLVVTAIKS